MGMSNNNNHPYHPKINVPILPQDSPLNSNTHHHQNQSQNASINTTVIRHDKEKRSKACANCRKSKVKCQVLDPEATDNQPCKRCYKNRLQCIFEYTIPSYKIVGGGRNDNNVINHKLREQENGSGSGSISPSGNASQHPNQHSSKHGGIPPIRLPPNQEMTYNKPNGNQVNSRPPQERLSAISALLNPSVKHNNNNNDGSSSPSGHWENSVEDRLQNFDSKLGSILTLLQNQRQNSYSDGRNGYLADDNNGSVHYESGKRGYIDDVRRPDGSYKRLRSESPDTNNQRYHRSHTASPSAIEYSVTSFSAPSSTSEDLKLEQVLTKEDAKHLFQYFDSNISPQLFGFTISKYSVDGIWDNCPLLLATICSIAAIHHPLLSHLFNGLEVIVHQLSQKVLFQTPHDELEAFNTVLALCFCGFWFQQSQMFTGLALQLAKTMRINSVMDIGKDDKSSKIPYEERLKLWYLLYILDGQQSLVFNRQPLIDGEKDEAVMNSRKLLTKGELVPMMRSISQPTVKLQEIRQAEIEDIEEGNIGHTKGHSGVDDVKKTHVHSYENSVSSNTSFTNLRLISQVEYNQAINAVFQGDGWGLLAPASFGIPFKTNLELDKWMVQWTVLLSPFNNGSVWSSKSTLIYYNFAKMHINSSAVRRLTMNGDNFPKMEDTFYEDPKTLEEIVEDGQTENGTVVTSSSSEDTDEEDEVEDEDGDDDDDEHEDDDKGGRKRKIKTDKKQVTIVESKQVSARLANGAAETVLNIVLSDPDILAALKYVPIHIHIMLYYAALLVLNPPSASQSFDSAMKALKLVKKLKTTVVANAPVDRGFSSKLVSGLTTLLRTKVDSLSKMAISEDMRSKLDAEVNANDPGVVIRSKSQKISAWPGYDHGHPSKSEK